ncbi:MAG: CYTH domain-containing protein [Culturomica sp.]|jgi:adenylate cyclase|nr:CYTH domain-containing protein [Culturomica sp.]
MNTEIERKFLVRGDFKSQATSSVNIRQGYLSSVPQRSVRVRIKGEKAFITVKGTSDISGVSRYEWEKEIPVNEASELLTLCEGIIIDKTRYYVPFKDHTFEVDEFHAPFKSLIIAEIELKSEDEPFEKPEWLGEEVTGNARYYNSQLSKTVL